MRRLSCQVSVGHGKAKPMFRKLAGATLAAAALTIAGVAPAQAALVRTGACDAATLTKPFAKYGDANLYKLMPGGDFEGALDGWSLRGAEVGRATGRDGRALILTAGDTVQTPSTCVNASYPTFRFFSRSQGLSTVSVEVVYALPLLGSLRLPVGLVTLGSGWSPAPPMLTASAVPGLLSGGEAKVSLRFTQVLGTSQIDDVFVDPRMR